jgi:hypothetical protein
MPFALRSLILALALVGCAHGVAQHSPAQPGMRLDQMQFIGTHNAYHIEPDAALRVVWQRSAAPGERSHETLLYTHPPLSAQASLGIRFFELDVHLDPEGGRYTADSFLSPMRTAGLEPDAPFDAEGRLARPGTKVFHTPTDMRSTCLLLVECLVELRAWLDENPAEGPAIIQIEPKDLLDNDADGQRSWAALESDILAAIPAARIFRPEDLAARPDQLRAAALAGRWPQLSALGGQFLFVLNGGAADTQSYTSALASGRAHLMFPALSDAQAPFAAFVSRNDPAAADIPDIVASGQMVITYADWRTYPARRNDTRGRDAAFASGAQLIATDYPTPDRRLSDYAVRFAEGYTRRRPMRLAIEPIPKSR